MHWIAALMLGAIAFALAIITLRPSSARRMSIEIGEVSDSWLRRHRAEQQDDQLPV